MSKMEQSMPTLETILSEVDQFVESDKTYSEAPHIIDVVLPLLCSYLPFWWAQGPDNVTPTAGWEACYFKSDSQTFRLCYTKPETWAEIKEGVDRAISLRLVFVLLLAVLMGVGTLQRHSYFRVRSYC